MRIYKCSSSPTCRYSVDNYRGLFFIISSITFRKKNRKTTKAPNNNNLPFYCFAWFLSHIGLSKEISKRTHNT